MGKTKGERMRETIEETRGKRGGEVDNFLVGGGVEIVGRHCRHKRGVSTR